VCAVCHEVPTLSVYDFKTLRVSLAIDVYHMIVGSLFLNKHMKLHHTF
jgi:hypothetical protein